MHRINIVWTDNIVKLLSSISASGLKFENCQIAVFSKVDTPLTIQYQEKFQSYSISTVFFSFSAYWLRIKMKYLKEGWTIDRLSATRKRINCCFRFKKQTVSRIFTYQPELGRHGLGRTHPEYICDNLLRVLTDYLLGHENTTLDFNCIQQVSNTLPVTLLDFDGNTVIPPYNMRTGTDQKFIDYKL